MELHPAVVEVTDPRRRLITSYGRPVNVAFALAEVLWILGGRDDVEMLKPYNSTIDRFSDDGVRFNAAYGKRLRHDFGNDQIDDVLHTLMTDPTSRQATLVISNPVDDKGWIREPIATEQGVEMGYTKKVTKDRACNLISHLMIRDGELDWLQVLRSNDAVWGVPYNMMQWTHLQEWIAVILGVRVGTYTFLADSLHIYETHRNEAEQITNFDLYSHLGDHTEMMAGIEVLNVLLREELVIRNLREETIYDEPPELARQVGSYWHAVLMVLLAHTRYRLGQDVEAAEALIESEPVFAAAQARFYFQNRWYKDRPECKEAMDLIAEGFGHNTEVMDWITTRVEG
jgi:thymidylate synthase